MGEPAEEAAPQIRQRHDSLSADQTLLLFEEKFLEADSSGNGALDRGEVAAVLRQLYRTGVVQ